MQKIFSDGIYFSHWALVLDDFRGYGRIFFKLILINNQIQIHGIILFNKQRWRTDTNCL